ncbi:hypothetical protein Cfor_10627 [Coptotermes formosanus]|uniref:F-box domain-containing protein n=1 Tax=Coptotermes formosanus TaxID=36987 RepID=A0A6L2Q396_COPFO|nr:hypothetical protein Cfor_10627 [Coptotermes formosanus]
MSSISAQGVVERASAELSKRINGLGLRSSKHHRNSSSSAATSNAGDAGGHGGGGGKASVMERVTNVFCGGSNSNNVTSCGGNVGAPEKPSRLLSSRSSKAASSAVNGNSVLVTPHVTRRIPASTVHQNTATTTASANMCLPHYLTWEQLILDERFLSKFFLYFTSGERRTLAQVCGKWRDVLYRTPRYWSGLIPVLRCRELRAAPCPERARLYSSLLRRGFHAVSLLGATDEDALDLRLQTRFYTTVRSMRFASVVRCYLIAYALRNGYSYGSIVGL